MLLRDIQQLRDDGPNTFILCQIINIILPFQHLVFLCIYIFVVNLLIITHKMNMLQNSDEYMSYSICPDSLNTNFSNGPEPWLNRNIVTMQ